jgi:osmoprotectant transport system ATP-binding protein
MGGEEAPSGEPVLEPVLELDRVGKHHGQVRALAPTSLGFREGRTTVLLGPSGCGKTTTLRLLMGLIAPDPGGGQVRFRGQPLTPHNLREIRVRMGYVVQDGGLFPHLTAEANVCLMARHLGWEPGRLRERLEVLARLVHLSAATLARHPAELSGGQRQRVGLMRALMLDPAVLLLDEPLAALDPLVRAELQDELGLIFATLRKTVVLVTHDLGEAAALGHELVLFKDGEIVQRGTLDDWRSRPATPFVTTFMQAQRRFDPDAGRLGPADGTR